MPQYSDHLSDLEIPNLKGSLENENMFTRKIPSLWQNGSQVWYKSSYYYQLFSFPIVVSFPDFFIGAGVP